MLEHYQQLGLSAGYEIGRSEQEVIFAHRATRAPALVAWIAGGLAGLAFIHTLLWPSLAIAGEIAAGQGWAMGAGFGAAVVPLFLLARMGYRRYQRRLHAPVTEVVGLRADLAAGVLRDGERSLAPLGEVQIDTPRNLGDSTQGSMRWVRLRWPGGRAMVYSAAARDAEQVAAQLTAWLRQS